jgi:hypothetical protein
MSAEPIAEPPAAPSADAAAEDEVLIAHLVQTRMAGDVGTSRVSNVGNIDKLLAGDPDYHFGVTLSRPWTAAEVLAVMARRVGVDPDPARRHGADRIDPRLTLAGLDAAADRIAQAAADRGRVLVATGHPTGLLALYLPLVAALERSGCRMLTPADGCPVPGIGKRPKYLRYAGPVAMLATAADLVHSHRAEPMQLMLESLRRADEPMPDLVIADHGWAGAAADAGLPTIGFADCNDPGVFVAAEQGLDIVAVPLDDNLMATTVYRPVAERLLRGLEAGTANS